MLQLKLIDIIIKEPLVGAHKNIPEITDRVKYEIKTQLKILKKISSEELIDNRIKKFCEMGIIK